MRAFAAIKGSAAPTRQAFYKWKVYNINICIGGQLIA